MPSGVPSAYTIAPDERLSNGAALASLILGILGCVPFITGLLAVIFGIVGIRKASSPHVGGKGMAMTGLILGLVSLMLWGLFGGGAFAMITLGKPARQAATQFVKDLAAGNIDAAHAQCTSNIQRQDLAKAAERVKSLGAVQDTSLPSISYSSVNGVSTTDVAGLATFANNNNVGYSARLVKQGGTFKVDGFSLQDVAAAGSVPRPKSSGSGFDD
jgi:hypothetical protein